MQAQLYFPPTDGSETWESMDPEELNWCQEKIDSLFSFLEERNTKAFMVLKDGKIVVENYFNDFNSDEFWYWASAAKTITATLTGKAMEDGLLSLEDPVSEYLGTGWTQCDSTEEWGRTVYHQLSMSSSFNNSIFLWDCVDPSCFQCIGAEPGTEWHYHNGVYRRLIEVVEAATGQNRNNYTDEVLEDITGMNGFWVDNLYFSRHRDMARFGLLALNDFTWDGIPVLTDESYIQALTSPSQPMNPSYGYLWWLNGQESHMLPLNPISMEGSVIPSGPDDMFMALGANDQKIYVIPSQNLIVTRQGDEAISGAPAVSDFDNELWAILSDMECDPLGIRDAGDLSKFGFNPNPSPSEVQLPRLSGIERILIFSIDGRKVMHGIPGEVVFLKSGVYVATAIDKEGRATSVKLVVK
jgi:CubicO group peptidase (beta-lactamase class C family)